MNTEAQVKSIPGHVDLKAQVGKLQDIRLDISDLQNKQRIESDRLVEMLVDMKAFGCLSVNHGALRRRLGKASK